MSDHEGRDLDLERELLALAGEINLRHHGEQPGPYSRAVRARLQLGAERYEPGAFRQRDNLVEVLEETPDVAAYVLLELQRLRILVPREEEWQELRMRAVAVIAAGFHADVAARQFQRFRDNLIG